jgi:hypothetical protein
MQPIHIITQLTHVTSTHKHTSSTSSVISYCVVYINFKIINLTHIVFIFNFVFIIMVYAVRWTKLDLACIFLKIVKSKLDPTYILLNFLN